MFTLEGLANLLNEPGVRSKMRKAVENAGGKQFYPADLRQLAIEIALTSQPHTIPSNFVEIRVGNGKKKKVVTKLSEVSQWDIKVVQDHIITCRCDPKLPYKQSRSFVKPISNETGTQYKHLITLTQRIKSLWMDLGPSKIALTKTDFYLLYLRVALGLRNYKKFNLANFVDEGLHSETLSILDNLYSMARDENKWLSSAMYREYSKQFGRKDDRHLFTTEMDFYPFYAAGKLLLQAREGQQNQSREIYLKQVVIWVAAQKESYDRTNSSPDLKLELGYLYGPHSTERFILYKDKLKKEILSQKQQQKNSVDISNLTRKRFTQ